MKKLFKKVHHFTKRELAAEELIIIFAICLFLAAASFAASAVLPVKLRLVQCGGRTDLPERCREDQRCCALMEKLGMSLPPDMDDTAKDGSDPLNFGDDGRQYYPSPKNEKDGVYE